MSAEHLAGLAWSKMLDKGACAVGGGSRTGRVVEMCLASMGKLGRQCAHVSGLVRFEETGASHDRS